MKYIQLLFLLAILTMGCNHPATKPADSTTLTDTLSGKEIINSDSIAAKKASSVFIQETHLHDTIFIKGDIVLFLRPDSTRFESYTTDDGSGIYSTDSDFGVGISTTMDTMKVAKKYKRIKTITADQRYISIRGCKSCPLLVDRDTIDYGLILVSPGKEIKINTFVHSGDYLGDVDDYFNLKNIK